MPDHARTLLGGALILTMAAPALAQDDVLNLYSSRHYNTDERLYSDFEEQTGITINRVEAGADALIERISNEGANSPADVLITVDAGRLWRAEEAGLLQPVDSEVLQERIPENLRDPDNHWFGFSTRARLIFYNPELVDAEAIGLDSYEDLTDPALEDLVCIRSSSNVYNLSLLGSIIEDEGEQAAEEWAAGVQENFAREPQGGDTDQLKALAAGECGVAVANHYYYLRLLQSDDPADQEVAAAIEPIFPNQDGDGTHVNISGAGVVATAPNRDAAVRFLEYLAGDEAQRYFAEGNNEFPAVPTVTTENEELNAMSDFKADDINVAAYGSNHPLAQKVYDRVGWQ